MYLGESLLRDGGKIGSVREQWPCSDLALGEGSPRGGRAVRSCSLSSCPDFGISLANHGSVSHIGSRGWDASSLEAQPKNGFTTAH